MGKFISDKDYQDVLGTSQEDYERVEYLSNKTPIVINSGIYPTEKTRFEIKLALKEHNPVLMMGCYDFTMGRKVALFKASRDCLMYCFPEDQGCHSGFSWYLSKPDGYNGDFPHVIEFGNNYIKDNTSNRKGGFAHEEGGFAHDMFSCLDEDPRVNVFSTNAPFGLFGIVEFRGEGLPLNYIIPKSDVYSIYYFKVYEKDQLIADMVPVKDGAGVLCMYDLVRNEFFYPVNESGKIVNLTIDKEPGEETKPKEEKQNYKEPGKETKPKEEKKGKGIFWEIVQSFKYAIKREWNPKYHGGKLEIIHSHGEYKVIAYSTTDNDKKVVWYRSDREVREASWKGSDIVLYCGYGHSITLYGPNNYDEII